MKDVVNIEEIIDTIVIWCYDIWIGWNHKHPIMHLQSISKSYS
jgi:hypothetical protein